jgi:hypothetical protein
MCLIAMCGLVCLSWIAPQAQAVKDGNQGEFEGESSWTRPAKADVVARFTQWLEESGATVERREALLARVNAVSDEDPQQLLEAVCEGIASVNPAAAPLIKHCQQPTPSLSLVDTEWLASSELDEWSASNLRLLYGRWLGQNQFYDEALEQLRDLKVDNVIDPASLLFYRSVAHHQLLQKDECLTSVTQLLEQRDAIPRRYSSVAELMYSDLKPLKTDSLDEISRMMNNVGRRLGFGRAGKRVRTEEEEILAKLDKMIEDLEKQQQQQQGGGGGAGSGGAPSSPMQDSSPAGGRGSGDVGNRDLGTGSPWGDLAPRERQETLQDITKDLPAHYREVLEEYFRKLARERNE